MRFCCPGRHKPLDQMRRSITVFLTLPLFVISQGASQGQVYHFIPLTGLITLFPGKVERQRLV